MIRVISKIVHVPAGKLSAGVVGVVTMLVLFFVLLNFDKTRSLVSIKNEGEGLYFMNYYEDMKLDSLLDTDISNIEELVQWIIKEHFYGLPVDIKKLQSGCSTFVCETKDGDTLLGRNFDYDDTDTLVIYSNPENGYASYGLADLAVLYVENNKIHPDSLLGRICMMAAPYAIEDGVNEAGLAVGILELDRGELHQDNGKRDLLKAVSKEDFTQWSCVYNLDQFEVTVYMDTDFNKSYSFR